jgi:hypothetical protein
MASPRLESNSARYSVPAICAIFDGERNKQQGEPTVTGVFLIYRNRMFGDAVRAVLGRCPDITLLGATDDPDSVHVGIDRLAPDVILLEEASDRSPMPLQAILMNPIPSRLVTLCLDRDGMHVWSQHWQACIGPDDLLRAIVSASGERGA